jgi:hypothetical protein
MYPIVVDDVWQQVVRAGQRRGPSTFTSALPFSKLWHQKNGLPPRWLRSQDAPLTPLVRQKARIVGDA